MKTLLAILAFFPALASASIPVALTLDDYPEHGPIVPGQTRLELARRIIEHLRVRKIPPVHAFMNGRHIHPDNELDQAVREWVSAGHLLANHTLRHVDINTKTIPEYIGEIEANEALFGKLGYDLLKLFRYPNLHEGETRQKRDSVRQYLFSRGYQIAHITIDSGDWAMTAPYVRCVEKGDQTSIQWMEKEFIKHSVKRLHTSRSLGKRLFNREIPQILIVHANSFEGANLRKLIDAYLKEGVKFIPLSEAMADPIYSIDSGWVSKDGKAFLDQLMEARGLPFPLVEPLPTEKLESLCR